MDKKAQEKIARWLWCQEAGYSWSENAVNDYETTLAKKAYSKKADQILKILNGLGYRKLPKGKPPLLSDNPFKEDGSSFDEYTDGMLHDIYEDAMEAQREADIKWYEG